MGWKQIPSDNHDVSCMDDAALGLEPLNRYENFFVNTAPDADTLSRQGLDFIKKKEFELRSERGER